MGTVRPLLLFPQVKTWESAQRSCTQREQDPEEP